MRVSILKWSFLLLAGYLVLEKNTLLAFFEQKVELARVSSHTLETLGGIYRYATSSIFDKGYVWEEGSEIQRRLLVYPKNIPLSEGHLVVSSNSSENIIRFTLPEGFKTGVLTWDATSKLDYKVGVSYDLNSWEDHDYQGYATRIGDNISFRKRSSADKFVYLRFLPSKDEKLDIYLYLFQYVSDLTHQQSEIYGLLFYPDTKIDYKGKEIVQPGIIYDSRKK